MAAPFEARSDLRQFPTVSPSPTAVLAAADALEDDRRRRQQRARAGARRATEAFRCPPHRTMEPVCADDTVPTG